MQVNGKLNKNHSISISNFLKCSDFTRERVVVEINGHIIDKSQYDDRILKADDHIEIVSFVGGG